MTLQALSSIGTGLTLVNTPSASTQASTKSTPILRRRRTDTAKVVNDIVRVTNRGTAPRETNSIWLAVIDGHLERLKPGDRAQCAPIALNASVDELAIAAIFEPLRKKYEKDRFYRTLKRVYPIAEHVLSFGKAIDVAVGSGGSLSAGLIWGGIRILLAVSIRTMSLVEGVLRQLEAVSKHLQLFDRWLKLFPTDTYEQLSRSIQETCSEFFNFILEAIMYFRKPPCWNAIKTLFTPGIEARFAEYETKISNRTGWLRLEVETATAEAAQKRGKEAKKLNEATQGMIEKKGDDIIQSIEKYANAEKHPKVLFPFRFVQNCPRNNGFFDRNDYMIQLERFMHTNSNRGPERLKSVVIHGLGGCGKSSVAREYMYRHFDSGRYKVILWFYADEQEKLKTQFIHLARQLGIPFEETTAHISVLHWINNYATDFLMIFDNADDPSVLVDFWPCSNNGSALITSRNPFAQESNLAEHALQMKAFTDAGGSAFLRTLIPKTRPLSSEDQEALEWLARYFGGLPLALRQAGAYITYSNCTPSYFKRLYQQHGDSIDQYQIPGALKHEKTMATVWEVSSKTISPGGLIILDVLSFFDPDSIPANIFEVANVSQTYGRSLSDPLRLLEAKANLTSKSLIDHDYNSNSFNIHRLLQQTIHQRLKKDPIRYRTALRLSIYLLHKFSPEVNLLMIRNPDNWGCVEKILSHIRSIYDHCKEIIASDEAVILLQVMTKILNYGFESAQYGLGDQVFAYIKELLNKIQCPEDETLALVYFIHGRLCCETSRQKQALEEIALSHEHLMLASGKRPELLETTLYIRILSNLGITHTAVGRFEEAEEFHKTAIEQYRLLHMERECSMGNILQNLANCYLWSGKMSDAKQTLDEARSQPTTSPEAIDYTLGNWMIKSQRYEEALRLHKEVLILYAKVLGPEHPVTADSWHKMGTLFARRDHAGYDAQEAE
ncbi:hypothetical protein AA0119_g12327 [Alternaria tenuissima]|uniref:NB-ARC domain-containing protein n=1 Tax=Alternaria tenuissima TaxID=119927 RepID=A0AB37WYW8_9PLEO|nr:hypothetical protein AA0115_g1954 [Alternaria tenuissima]RYN87917.1 hypothetical protein AA0119_g12327 [Alternaria tenuissima]RYO10018.1 hypothetical protein AA0121_g10648 [Alternaria tenuissima]